MSNRTVTWHYKITHKWTQLYQYYNFCPCPPLPLPSSYTPSKARTLGYVILDFPNAIDLFSSKTFYFYPFTKHSAISVKCNVRSMITFIYSLLLNHLRGKKCLDYNIWLLRGKKILKLKYMIRLTERIGLSLIINVD